MNKLKTIGFLMLILCIIPILYGYVLKDHVDVYWVVLSTGETIPYSPSNPYNYDLSFIANLEVEDYENKGLTMIGIGAVMMIVGIFITIEGYRSNKKITLRPNIKLDILHFFYPFAHTLDS